MNPRRLKKMKISRTGPYSWTMELDGHAEQQNLDAFDYDNPTNFGTLWTRVTARFIRETIGVKPNQDLILLNIYKAYNYWREEVYKAEAKYGQFIHELRIKGIDLNQNREFLQILNKDLNSSDHLLRQKLQSDLSQYETRDKELQDAITNAKRLHKQWYTYYKRYENHLEDMKRTGIRGEPPLDMKLKFWQRTEFLEIDDTFDDILEAPKEFDFGEVALQSPIYALVFAYCDVCTKITVFQLKSYTKEQFKRDMPQATIGTCRNCGNALTIKPITEVQENATH